MLNHQNVLFPPMGRRLSHYRLFAVLYGYALEAWTYFLSGEVIARSVLCLCGLDVLHSGGVGLRTDYRCNLLRGESLVIDGKVVEGECRVGVVPSESLVAAEAEVRQML